MADYEAAPESKDPLNLRVPKSLKRRIEKLTKLWVAQAKFRGDDPTNVDVTHVVTKMLRDQVAASFDALGGEPMDDTAISRAEEAIEKTGRCTPTTKK